MPNDNPLNVNLSTAGRFGAGGLLTGASLASVLGLLKMINDMREDSKVDGSEDTDRLVLTLPAKRASADELIDTMFTDNFISSLPKIGPDMEKAANWQTLVASLLAAGGAGSAGYALVDKLFEMRRMKELNDRVGESQQEYLDKLDAASTEIKSAGIFDSAEGESSFNKLDYPIGLAVLATLLGAGGSGWLTKRFLDQTSDDKLDPGFKPRKPIKVKRIVFRTAGPGEKAASVEDVDPDTLQAALGVYLDICSGKPELAADEKVAEELVKMDMKPSDLYKQAATEFDTFIQMLHTNPELKEQMKRMSMDKHPILKYLKWSVGLPIIDKISDDSMYDTLSRKYGPASNMFPEPYQDYKQASVLDSLIGSLAADQAVDSVKDMVVNRGESRPTEVAPEIEAAIRELEIGAADPNAEEFVNSRQDEIKAILTKLVEEGKI